MSMLPPFTLGEAVTAYFVLSVLHVAWRAYSCCSHNLITSVNKLCSQSHQLGINASALIFPSWSFPSLFFSVFLSFFLSFFLASFITPSTWCNWKIWKSVGRTTYRHLHLKECMIVYILVLLDLLHVSIDLAFTHHLFCSFSFIQSTHINHIDCVAIMPSLKL
jgi:hypothetical protein